MSKFFLILFFVTHLVLFGQKNSDSIQCYAIINFIIENKSLIESQMKIIENEENATFQNYKQGIEMLIKQFEMDTIWQIQNSHLPILVSQIKNMQSVTYDKTKLCIIKYKNQNNSNFDDELIQKLNEYLDSKLRENELIDTTKSFWSISLTNLFPQKKSATITYHSEIINEGFFIALVIDFLFDENNRIENVNISILRV